VRLHSVAPQGLVMWAATVALVIATTMVLQIGEASAAPGQLTPVVGFGSNPGDLLMFEWVPEDLPPNAPVVVVLHGCFASATVYDDETGWTALADRWNVALVFPEQIHANNPTKCFSWEKPEDHTRGQGEALSVKQMVDWMHANRDTNPQRVYVTGHSGGGAFTSVMLATYPDVFKAGAVVAGAPYKCGKEGAIAFDPNPQMMGGDCVDGSTDKSAQQWGDLARSGHPGYRGPKPRVSIWHGTADTMVTPRNLGELVEQWTNFHGIDQTADSTETMPGVYEHNTYRKRTGPALVESWELPGRGHGWPYDAGDREDQCNGGLPSADYDICAAYHIGRWFGFAATTASATAPGILPQ
jgi:poly(hydroxyalkanoate) depolymerase family esterase